MLCQVRRISMEALDVEMRIAAGEPALRAWLQFPVGAQEAPEDDEGFNAQRPVHPQADTAGEFLVMSVDGKGVAIIRPEAVKRTSTWGSGVVESAAVRWSSTAWRAKASAAASQDQRPCWHCMPSRRP
jgi:hypothetical protein